MSVIGLRETLMYFRHSRCLRLAVWSLLAFAANVRAAVQITTSSLPDGIVGAGYSQSLTATGGTAPYTWSVTIGQLPNGLSLSSSGTISGTPTASGIAIFTIQVRAAAGGERHPAIHDDRRSGPSVSPPPLCRGESSAWPIPRTWRRRVELRRSSGRYRRGRRRRALRLVPAARSAARHRARGNASFTVQVKDSKGAIDTQSLTLAVAAAVSVYDFFVARQRVGKRLLAGAFGVGRHGSLHLESLGRNAAERPESIEQRHHFGGRRPRRARRTSR